MTAPPDATTRVVAERCPAPPATWLWEGVIAGLVGAATIALWFLLLDTIQGHPLYTPTLLGSALFRPGAGLPSPGGFVISFEMVLLYTGIHWLAFCIVGVAVSRLLELATRKPHIGFAIVLLFVVFQFGFIAAAMILEEPVLRALGWVEVLWANLLAAATTGTYLWSWHPNVTIPP